MCTEQANEAAPANCGTHNVTDFRPAGGGDHGGGGGAAAAAASLPFVVADFQPGSLATGPRALLAVNLQ